MAQQTQIRELPLIWMRKFLTPLVLLDIDKDGVMGYEDHMQMAESIIKAGNLTGEARDGIYKIYKHYCESGTSQDIANSSSLANQLLTIWKERDNPETVGKLFEMFSRSCEVLCLDSSGFMTFDNYMIFWNALGIDKRFARMQFDYIDTNGDGLISREEFAKAFIDYMLNIDENTSNRFFGPLINY
ncbi:unnamed protein product [Owenia fusiformis]|uniref:Uncharacterized protein n=1 Tax=Owenia fusiformis TaxID=6347 RepID=A0A8J1XJ33_OWEFU|nr:unnamed protein product [Owenia fusiformis]